MPNINAVRFEQNPVYGVATGKRDVSAQKASQSFQMPDALSQRQALAKKQAGKIVRDAYAGEKKTDVNVQGLKDQIASLRRDSAEAGENIDRLNSLIEDARKQHGIAEGSREDRELELLRRAGTIEGKLNMTDEERSEVAAIKERGLTQAQKDFEEHTKSYYEQLSSQARLISENDALIQANNSALNDIAIERLKSDPVGDALKQADEIMAAASEDAVTTLFAEAVENIDEKQEETKEAAKERADREQELKERIEKNKERDEEQKKLTEDILESAESSEVKAASSKEVQDKVDSKIGQLLDKLKLISEDIKGVQVDDTL